jgi:glucosamine--fructose-6-phosphate aminotransferase (isomerizing)
MAKEIHEQPEVVGRTLAYYLDMSERAVRPPFELSVDPARLSRLSITGCGTAYYAGLVAKYWFEKFARLPVDVDFASEFRYREPPLANDGLSLFVSQSGETADTLASLRYAKEHGQTTLSVVNVLNSSIARESAIVAPTLAGPEIGVASTKAFVCQLATLACLAIFFGRARGTLDRMREIALVDELIETPGRIADAIRSEASVEELAREIAKRRDVLYLARGLNYPLALEGALKLKEISYIHAEGYAAGELKHGPIALIEEETPVVVIAAYDELAPKMISNMQEVAARGGRIILVGDRRIAEECGVPLAGVLAVPDAPPTFSPMIYAVPVQFLAYHTALSMGKDVDQPRNLAKSVTVE